MKVIQCEHGHYYDKERYQECPICKKQNEKKDERKRISSEMLIPPEDGLDENDVDVSQFQDCNAVTVIIDAPKDEIHTLQPETKKADNKSRKPTTLSIARPDDNGETVASFGCFGGEPKEEYLPLDTEPVRPSDDGKTVTTFGESGKDNGEQDGIQVTTPMYNRHNGPVVGWVVAIDGPHKGQSFELYAKKNYIGRNEKMSINLLLDKTVSRTSPISIIFDSKNNIFITMAGQSDQTAYVNEQIVLQPIELNNFDKIVVGKTVLLFVPLITKEHGFDDIYKVG